MATDLRDRIRELIDGGAPPVTVEEIESRTTDPHLAPIRPPGRRPGRVVGAAAAVVAVGCAGAIAATQLTGSGGGGGVRLTAANIRQVASASRSALASSGRAVVSYRDFQNGVLQDSGTDVIAFSHGNWNDAFRVTYPAADGQPASTQSAINRIVNGRFYLYIAGRTSRHVWYRDTNAAGHPSFTIPDPRTALRALSPAARFRSVGWQTIDGIRLRELVATRTRQLNLSGLPDLQPGERVTRLEVWVDGSNVVHRMTLTAEQRQRVATFRLTHVRPSQLPSGARIVHWRKGLRLNVAQLHHELVVVKTLDRRIIAYYWLRSTGHLQLDSTSLAITFADFGRPQSITAPRHAIPQYGRG